MATSAPGVALPLTAGQEIELQAINRGGVQAPDASLEVKSTLDEVKEAEPEHAELRSADAGSPSPPQKQQQDDSRRALCLCPCGLHEPGS
jgi:hypothetical protein